LDHTVEEGNPPTPRHRPPGPQRQPGFRRLVTWRTGCEGASASKHHYDLHRIHLDGLTGARIWCGYGILAHNLTSLAAAQTA
jgi:IS5 family transposase